MKKNPVIQGIIVVIFGALLVVVLWQVGVKTYDKYQLQLEINKLREQAASLKQKNESLSKLANSFDDQNFLEKEARRRLNLRAQGEGVIVIVPEGEEIDTPTNPAQSALIEIPDDTPRTPNWQRWLNYFFE